MNTKALQCFIKVYEKKSITSAAKEVYISPQGLSKIIKQLEIELDTELFFRGAQGMEATESGELLYARARHICYLMEDIQKEIRIINGSSSALNVIVSYSINTEVPLEKILGFSEKHPNIQINVKEYPDDYPMADLFQDEADVGIIIGNEGIKDCQYTLLVAGRAVLVVSVDHPLASVDEVSIMDLTGETLVIKSIETGKEHGLIEKAQTLGVDLSVKHESSNLATIHSLCENQKIVGVSVNFLERAFPREKLKVLKLKEKIPQNIYLVTRNREVQNKAVSIFQNYIINQRSYNLR